MMNKHVTAVVNVIKELIGSEFLVMDVIEEGDSVQYVRYGVMTRKGFVAILTLQHGYDVIHGKFTKTNRCEATALIANAFSASAYLLSKEKCVTALQLIKAITNNASDKDTELWKTTIGDVVGSLDVTLASKDFRTIAKVHFNNRVMEIYSMKKFRIYQNDCRAKNLGLSV